MIPLLTKRNLVMAGAILLAAGAWWLYYTFFVFHITEVSPETPDFPSSSNMIVITFNKPLKENSYKEGMVAISPDIKSTVNFNGSTIRIKLTSRPEADTKLTVTLKNIESSSGDYLSKTLNYTATYVPFKDLSEVEREEQVKESDSFETDFPLITSLPIRTSKYSIDYNLPPSNDERMPLFISMNFGPRTSSAEGLPTAQDMEEYRKEIRIYRAEAIKALENLKYDKTRYQLYFSEDELVAEFDGKYVGEFLYTHAD